MMIDCTSKELSLLQLVGTCADKLKLPCYLVGGFVRDKLLNRSVKILILFVGDGIELAHAIAETIQPKPVVSF